MDTQNEHLDTLKEIRDIMDRSTRFISLSGWSGIFPGIFALAGASIAHWHLAKNSIIHRSGDNININTYTVLFLMMVAGLVLFLSLGAGIFFTLRKARKDGASLFDKNAQRLIFNLAIPLAVGGLFCALLLFHGVIFLIAPCTLIFYGLALLHASKYTYGDIRYLGMIEIALGLLSGFYIGYGLYFWALGFGIMHIVYGVRMFFKYERV